MILCGMGQVVFMLVSELITINANSPSTFIYASSVTGQVEVYKLEEFILHQACIEQVLGLR